MNPRPRRSRWRRARMVLVFAAPVAAMIRIVIDFLGERLRLLSSGSGGIAGDCGGKSPVVASLRDQASTNS